MKTLQAEYIPLKIEAQRDGLSVSWSEEVRVRRQKCASKLLISLDVSGPGTDVPINGGGEDEKEEKEEKKN